MSAQRPKLLAIVELGGYPNFAPLYRGLGFDVELATSQRRAQAWLKRTTPEVIVAEYNFQSDFRDRSSNLETLMARLQKTPQVRVIVFYQREYEGKLDGLKARFPIFGALPLPVDPSDLEQLLRRALPPSI